MRLWKIGWTMAALLMSGFCACVWAQFDEIDKKWQQEASKIDTKWEHESTAVEDAYARTEREQQAKWAQIERRIRQKWDDFVRSTNKDWVAYNDSFDSRSRVDFEKGKIRVEAVVLEDDPVQRNNAVRQLKKQVQTLFEAEDGKGGKILDTQVADRKGDPVDADSAANYFDQELKSKVTVEPKPYVAHDGRSRRKYAVQMDLVPEHIRVRAQGYIPAVTANAKRFRLNPQLIMAVIHTESFFNPRAVSHAGAVGLMQIIPKYAGRDAYQFLYGQDQLITDQYLYDPLKNIEMGCAYLHLLKYQHFKDVNEELKNRYVSICGYNWGPTSMRKKIIDRMDVQSMPDKKLFQILRAQTPKETSDYIKRVTDRMPIYDPFFM